MNAEAADSARALLAACYDGVLATISVAVPGYPFGSVVPYCLDGGGLPVILIAGIAQHTRNARADPRLSLTVFDRNEPDLQTAGRVTLLGDAIELEGPAAEQAAARYLRFFPTAAGYDRMHDFAYFGIVPRRLRFIGGFGDIHWFEPAAVIRANPFAGEAERGIVEHMNADHGDAVAHYCHLAGIAIPEGAVPVLAGCDGEGMHVRVGERIHYMAFPQAVSDLTAVRAVLVAMARR